MVTAMTDSPSLYNLTDDAALLSHEHQCHLIDLGERLGEHNWQADLAAGTLDLVGASAALRTRVHLLGSTSESAGSWLWGWANQSGFPPAVLEVAGQAGQFGRQHAVTELVEAELPLHPDLVPRLVDAAKLVTGHWTSYSGQAGPGTRAYFLIDAPELALPAPGVHRTVRVIGEVLSGGLLRDQRRAVVSYARLRGLAGPEGPAVTAEGAFVLPMPDGDLVVSFDEHGRISNLSAQAIAPR
jgi:hypothetical protein